MSNEERLEQLINELQLIMKDLGVATAYGYAVEKGYTGTEEEFAELMASYATVAQDAAHSAEQAAESATNAHNSEINAGTSEGHAEQAKLDAQAAKNAAETAQGKAEEAQGKAETAETNADTHAENAEAWAVGTRDGSPVGQTDPTYHNNAKYYAELADTKADQAADSASDASDAKDTAVSAKNDAVDAKDIAVSAKNDAVDAKDTAVSAKNDAELAETGAVNAKNDSVDAKDAAVSAKNDAQTAKDQAVSAKNDAVNAKTDAQTAKDQAVTAKNDAQTAKDQAVSAKNDAVTAKNGAVDAKDAAQAAQAAAEEAATHVADMALMQAIAPKYVPAKEYKIGNLLTYQGKQYEVTGDDGVAPPVGTLPTDTNYFTERPVSEIIDMIKNGTIVTGHSQVADNLTPYSEDSGTTQENPFISQGTGTDNNSVIVTTGVIARQLEKQGNTIPVVQLAKALNSTNWTPDNATSSYSDGVGTFTATQSGGQIRTFVSLIAGHKYLLCAKIKLTTATTAVRFNVYADVVPGYDSTNIYTTATTSWQNIMGVKTAGGTSVYSIRIRDDRASDWDAIQVKEVCAFDITSWNSSIITDLTSHPSHFSWYYNGSMSYDAGSLQNCNGRYLECGQGRNLINPATMVKGIISTTTGQNVTDTSGQYWRTPEYYVGVANREYFLKLVDGYTTNNANGNVYCYDKYKNFISCIENKANNHFTLPANCIFVRVSFFFITARSTAPDSGTLSLYYTTEEGGEGYDANYDYIAPIRIDTGNEPLKAFDKKLPSGVIERNTGEVDFATLAWTYQYGHWTSTSLASVIKTYGRSGLPKGICSSLALVPQEYQSFNNNVVGAFGVSPTGTIILVNGSDSVSPTGTFQYELANPTTEQGTPFSEYADINDYSYMAWFDNDGNLVSIPQGCKLFYPVDYKGFTDDLVMYTNGDATALAKNEDITDTALNARGYYKMQDLSSSVTLATGVTATLKKAYKHGNVITMSLVLQNTSGAELSSYSTLFTLASGMFPANQYIVAYVEANNLLKRFRINPSGEGGIEYALPNSGVVYINISYAVA